MTLTESVEKAEPKTQLESWNRNERMRHAPQLDWLISKIDVDLRARIEQMLLSVSTVSHDDPHWSAIETELRGLARAIDRLGDAVRHKSNGHPPNELAQRIGWSLTQAVASLNTLDPDLFGRRYPFQTFERSKAE